MAKLVSAKGRGGKRQTANGKPLQFWDLGCIFQPNPKSRFMKAIRNYSFLLIALLTILSSCSYRIVHVKSMPPGHAKKVYGSKSAKHHAPGQKKKYMKR